MSAFDSVLDSREVNNPDENCFDISGRFRIGLKRLSRRPKKRLKASGTGGLAAPIISVPEAIFSAHSNFNPGDALGWEGRGNRDESTTSHLFPPTPGYSRPLQLSMSPVS